MTVHAFAPGHVSGLFAVHDEAADPLAKGSRGAGWSLDRGAVASVREAESTQITIDGVDALAPVTRSALGKLDTQLRFRIDLKLGLPVGQGFGMSAAGTLAACLGACALAGLEPERAVEATHVAEVRAGTGLGDAVGSWFGGAEVRARPGCPPHGWALRIDAPESTRFLFSVVGDPIATAKIVRDETWAERTRSLGDAAVERISRLGRHAAWEAVLSESHAFSRELGLMPPAMAALGAKLPKEVRWGQAMLGHALWATGPPPALDEARRVLAAGGSVIEAALDPSGARLVPSAAAAQLAAIPARGQARAS